ncbi:unnamed protein product [Ranitomeya imitator]|uniref:G-protein coupled receptors family 1 profile domain-containing protein n=1 Tax=Ranitomeya imitator TaxID=111125 RepID=A0ABN9KS79_9NEOB|nr:unnamed protein product [Ranitomeya imitator]
MSQIMSGFRKEKEKAGPIVPPFNISSLGFGNQTHISRENLTFSFYYQHSSTIAAMFILAYTFIFLMCMIGNMLVCFIVLKNRQMRTVTNMFILNLAISDLLVGIFCMPTTLVDNLITGCWPQSWVPGMDDGGLAGSEAMKSSLVPVQVCEPFQLAPLKSICCLDTCDVFKSCRFEKAEKHSWKV